jgi:hypothetical protein
MNSTVASLLAIVVCGASGGLLGWLTVRWLGLNGATGAIVAAMLGVAFATFGFIGIIALLRAYRGARR